MVTQRSVTHSIEVDEIVSARYYYPIEGGSSVTPNELFILKADHARVCWVCEDNPLSWPESYRFVPGESPIVRFTSEGLEVT